MNSNDLIKLQKDIGNLNLESLNHILGYVTTLRDSMKIEDEKAILRDDDNRAFGYQPSHYRTKLTNPKTRVFIEPSMISLSHIDGDFKIGKYQVTFDEYDLYCEDIKIVKPSDNGWGRGKRPVINVTWHAAVAYCEWLSNMSEGYYRLPTETEWEYACRAGTTTKWSFGNKKKKLKKYAWYAKNAYDKEKGYKSYGARPVGQKQANSWGLYDIHGNVWEWCEDWYDKDKNRKVMRGGSWISNAVYTRSSFRGRNNPSVGSNIVGFRLVKQVE